MACTWLTVEEAADFLKVDKSTLYRYIKQGLLKTSRPGGHMIRICLEVLNTFGEESNASTH
ncbi:hypothetical protein LCGC14_1215460 [marine sediment metagenome]|uniref:Helix-turn-helix domain-containing protein n=1 Tax=marine sediment metagenome TaxID=412755 RepID=A0A0F9LCZ9_9ZZZZ